MNPLFQEMETTIFDRMSVRASALGAVNLGQGFPDFGWPEEVVARAASALTTGSNQYAPMRGLAELRSAVADHYRRHMDLDLDPEQIIVTSGATEALAASIAALVTPGDEVLLFQPLYDAYLPLVLRAGGVPRFIRLAPPGWRITRDALDEAFTDRIRLVVFNNPHNPSARIFDDGELARLAEACVRHDVVALSDEVWEHVVFDGRRHRPLSALPGMAERTVKVGSAGKIFALTGWKVGWVVAPPPLADPIAKAHQFLTFSTAPNLQSAVAWGLADADRDLQTMRSRFGAARDGLVASLAGAGFATLPAEATWFVCIDLPGSGLDLGDLEFCERALGEAGVAAIPVSAFYAERPVTSVVRLCFAKSAPVLAQAAQRLAKARSLLR